MAEMTSRERVRATLSLEEPDRVPLDLGGINTTLMTGTYNNLKSYLGMGETPTRILSRIWQIVEPDEGMLQRFSIDTRYLFPRGRKSEPQASTRSEPSSGGQGTPASAGEAPRAGDTFIDEWGITRKFVMHYYEIAEHPLAEAETVEDIESYPWPDPAEQLDLTGLAERGRYLRDETDFAVVGYTGGASIFEMGWYLRGYEKLLVDMMIDKEMAHALFGKILEVRKKAAQMVLAETGEYLDVLQFGDDIATQEGPAFSPVLYREMVKPYQAELFGSVKEKYPVKIYYHSCGGVRDLVDDLIEIGVDALNPVQVQAKGMDTAELKRRFGGRVAFWGAIDSQHALPFGTPEDVRREVRKRIGDLAPGGGYVLAGIHNLQPDISPQNIEAMYDEGLKSGTYPIKIPAPAG